MHSQKDVEDIFNEIRMKASEEAGSSSTRKPIVFAREVEQVVQMLIARTGVALTGFMEFFQTKWLLCKFPFVN
jgi:hypothetical protein